ncbi:hypothetical protein [Nocardia sp. GP40]|uniref:hypothetical protein n=1 Tax=Nocardia sp. GP40 TaxID=3156268 RepID=UPI003D233354
MQHRDQRIARRRTALRGKRFRMPTPVAIFPQLIPKLADQLAPGAALPVTSVLISNPLLQPTLPVDLLDRHCLCQSRIGLQRQHRSRTLNPRLQLHNDIRAHIATSAIQRASTPPKG